MLALPALLFAIVAPGTAAGLVPYLLLSSGVGGRVSLGAARYVGLLPMLLGAAGLAWCFYDFAARGRGTPAPYDPPKRLVVSGPYRVVRNPMYVCVTTILLGEAIVFQAPALVGWAAAFLLTTHLFVTLYEEPTLGDKFGDDYARYCARVPRWLPRGWAGETERR